MALKYFRAVCCTVSLVGSLVTVSSSAIAATMAESAASVRLFNFSHNPTAIDAFRDGSATTIGNPGQINAGTQQLAEIDDETITCEVLGLQQQTCARNLSLSQAAGTGLGYQGQARSIAGVVGTFDIEAGETFAFTFEALLNLSTSVNDPATEEAIAFGNIFLGLFAENAPIPFEALLLSGQKSGLSDAFFDFAPSSGFTGGAGGNQTTFGIRGGFSQTFSQATRLTLREFKQTNAEVTAVPTPSLLVPLLGMATACGRRALKRRKMVQVGS
jgi:hypothetical protein